MEQSVVHNSDLIETLQHYADLFTFSPIGSVVVGEEGRVEDANRAAAATLGWPRSWIVGQLFSRWLVRRDVSRFLEHINDTCRSRCGASGIFRIQDRHGEVRELRIDSSPLLERTRSANEAPRLSASLRRCQLTLIDLTEKPSTPEHQPSRRELTHMARVSSSGEIATALAHELSQPLGAISLYCSEAARLLRDGAADGERVIKSLERAAEAATHASRTIRDLRSFLRKDDDEAIEMLSIADVVRLSAKLSAAVAKRRGVRIELRLAPDLPAVRANRTHLQQVLLNLLQNAIDAVHELEPERRRVSVSTERLDNATICVTVADLGDGLSELQRRQAFEPFFTTKTNGMGVGLPISRMIIESYGGRLWAPRKAGRGATFCFTLPIHEHD